MEAGLQLADPLVDQVRRAEHGEAVDLAAVEQLAGDERGLDGLADADVVGDEQAHRVQLERHQQRHELVGARLDGDLAEAAERARRRDGARGAARRAGAARRRGPPAGRASGRGKVAVGDRLGLEREVDERLVFLGARDRAHAQRLGVASRQDDPLAAAGADEAPGAA